jgi:hypothetical protein
MRFGNGNNVALRSHNPGTKQVWKRYRIGQFHKAQLRVMLRSNLTGTVAGTIGYDDFQLDGLCEQRIQAQSNRFAGVLRTDDE